MSKPCQTVGELIKQLQRYRPNAYVKFILGSDVCHAHQIQQTRGGAGVHVICTESHSNGPPPTHEEIAAHTAILRAKQLEEKESSRGINNPHKSIPRILENVIDSSIFRDQYES